MYHFSIIQKCVIHLHTTAVRQQLQWFNFHSWPLVTENHSKKIGRASGCTGYCIWSAEPHQLPPIGQHCHPVAAAPQATTSWSRAPLSFLQFIHWGTSLLVVWVSHVHKRCAPVRNKKKNKTKNDEQEKEVIVNAWNKDANKPRRKQINRKDDN